MCRWLAYSGPPVLMSTLLTRPDHSLIDQSRQLQGKPFIRKALSGERQRRIRRSEHPVCIHSGILCHGAGSVATGVSACAPEPRCPGIAIIQCPITRKPHKLKESRH